jgi:CspA family cold shock protein
MARGTVKWYSTIKGCGFIRPDDDGPDVFVHYSALDKAGYSNVREGTRISYEVKSHAGRPAAENLRLD